MPRRALIVFTIGVRHPLPKPEMVLGRRYWDSSRFPAFLRLGPHCSNLLLQVNLRWLVCFGYLFQNYRHFYTESTGVNFYRYQ